MNEEIRPGKPVHARNPKINLFYNSCVQLENSQVWEGFLTYHHRFYTYKGLAMCISINSDVTFDPHYGLPPKNPHLFSLPETLYSVVGIANNQFVTADSTIGRLSHQFTQYSAPASPPSSTPPLHAN